MKNLENGKIEKKSREILEKRTYHGGKMIRETPRNLIGLDNGICVGSEFSDLNLGLSGRYDRMD